MDSSERPRYSTQIPSPVAVIAPQGNSGKTDSAEMWLSIHKMLICLERKGYIYPISGQVQCLVKSTEKGFNQMNLDDCER